jgi:hypothetical protein
MAESPGLTYQSPFRAVPAFRRFIPALPALPALPAFHRRFSCSNAAK